MNIMNNVKKARCQNRCLKKFVIKNHRMSKKTWVSSSRGLFDGPRAHDWGTHGLRDLTVTNKPKKTACLNGRIWSPLLNLSGSFYSI